MGRVVVGRDGTEQVGHCAVGAARVDKELLDVEGFVSRNGSLDGSVVRFLDGVAEGERGVAPQMGRDSGGDIQEGVAQ